MDHCFPTGSCCVPVSQMGRDSKESENELHRCLKIKLKKCLLLWRDGTANKILQVVTATSCKRIYSTLKLPSYLWDHEEIKCTHL